MNTNDPRTKLNEISLSNGANLSQSELSEMHCYSIGYSMKHVQICVLIETNQIQFALEFHHIIWKKEALLWHKTRLK